MKGLQKQRFVHWESKHCCENGSTRLTNGQKDIKMQATSEDSLVRM